MKLEQYRDIWLSEKFSEHIGFYPREFSCLDNFASFKVLSDETLFTTVEHAYQAEKFKETDSEIYNKIIDSYSAHDAQKIAYENKHLQVNNWDEIKVDFMEKLLRLKLEQNPYVKHKLKQTKDYLIVEDSPKDSFWGIGENRDGKNMLGKLWMKLRDELNKTV